MVTDIWFRSPSGRLARAARSIAQIRAQINDLSPGRSTRSDGIIGDWAHSQSTSDHNPNSRAVVTAYDITHDPNSGVDCERLYQALVESRDPRIKYIIWRSTITSSYKSPWKRRRYSGSNKHDKHLHLSVHGDYDSTARWDLSALGSAPDPSPIPEEVPTGSRTLRVADPQMGGTDVAALQAWTGNEQDGWFGAKTEAGVKKVQQMVGIPASGVVDEETWRHFHAWVAWMDARRKAAEQEVREREAREREALQARLPLLGKYTGPARGLSAEETGGKYHGGVEKAQVNLHILGFLADRPDGWFGKNTKAAVLALQKARGIEQDGKIGAQTWAEMEKAS